MCYVIVTGVYVFSVSNFSGSGLENRLTAVGTRCADHVSPLYPQKLALISPTGGGRSVSIVRSRTKVTELLHVSALHCHLQGGFLVPSERCSIEEQSTEYCGWVCLSSDVVRSAHHVTRHNTSIHKILWTAPQLSISQKAQGTLPEDGNVMPKHVGATIHD